MCVECRPQCTGCTVLEWTSCEGSCVCVGGGLLGRWRCPGKGARPGQSTSSEIVLRRTKHVRRTADRCRVVTCTQPQVSTLLCECACGVAHVRCARVRVCVRPRGEGSARTHCAYSWVSPSEGCWAADTYCCEEAYCHIPPWSAGQSGPQFGCLAGTPGSELRLRLRQAVKPVVLSARR